MIIYLFGPDSYRRQQKLNSILENYQEKHSGFSIDYFDLESPDELLRLKDYCAQESLFASKRMAIVKNAPELETEDIKSLEKLLKPLQANENVILILTQDKPLPKSFEFISEKPNISQEFPPLTDAKLEFFIAKEAKDRNINLDQEAVNFLIEVFNVRTKGDIWGLITELDRLQFLHPFLNKERDGVRLTEIDLQGQIYSFQKPELFKFTDAIGKNKSMQYKLYFLDNLFLNEEEPAKIFNILSANPYLSAELVERLADFDVAVKSGKIDYETALFELCLT